MNTILVQENLVENVPVNKPLTACKQYYLAAGATQGNIAYTRNVIPYFKTHR
jgi:hypothetical protein